MRTIQSLPPALWTLIAVLGAIQLALMVAALAHLFRLPVERIRYGNRWIWVGVAVLLNTIGPILVLLGAALPPTVDDTPEGTRATSAADHSEVADLLYGDAEPSDR